LYDDTTATQFFSGYFPIDASTFALFTAMSGINGHGAFDNQAVGYQTTHIIVGNNAADAAILTTSPAGNDAIFANGNGLTMQYPLGSLDFTGLSSGDSIIADSTGGGTNTISKRAIDFALTMNGSWNTQ
jgi:hypothetical protein